MVLLPLPTNCGSKGYARSGIRPPRGRIKKPSAGGSILPRVLFLSREPWGATRSQSLSIEEAVPLRLDGQASANDVAFGAQVLVPPPCGIAAGIEAERILRAHVEMLIFEAEEHVDQRALVDHVVEAAAGIPAAVARLAVKSGQIGLVEKTGN